MRRLPCACGCNFAAALAILALPVLLIASCDGTTPSGSVSISAQGGGEVPAAAAAEGPVGIAVRWRLAPLFPWTPRAGFPTASWPWGQCTWFVVHEGHLAGSHRVTWGGNADSWYANAEAQGVPTEPAGAVPEPGWIAVYAPGHGSDPNLGHVAVVVQVLATDGKYTIAEMNVLGLGVADTRTLRLGGTNPLLEGWIR